ncbi:MAG: hypothetical protein IPN69_20870 [Acidobacteria bacterium]|nr:hypothetical protein [Acidobacteriota bacterium]
MVTTVVTVTQTDGIKVQTRYKTVSSYVSAHVKPIPSGDFVSRVRRDDGLDSRDRVERRHTLGSPDLSGSALPIVFGGGNANSTGIVRTDIDTNTTTVTDQVGKQRRSITNALG